MTFRKSSEKEYAMSKYMTKSKATQMSEMQRAHKVPHPGTTAANMLTHENISKRAYEIYVKNGCQEGQSQHNWLQAEYEIDWLQGDDEMKVW
jgi:hypothetical protein